MNPAQRWTALAVAATILIAGCVTPPATVNPPTNETSTPRTNTSWTWPAPSDAIVRPGVRIGANDGCTAGFVFRARDNQSVYVSTAAHCFRQGWNESQGTHVNDTVPIAGGQAEGRLVFLGARTRNGSYDGQNASQDFALVEVLPKHQDTVHPQVLGHAGPAGMVETIVIGDPVTTYGNSTLRGDVERFDAREGEVTEGDHTDGEVRVAFDVPSIPGDSGSPVMTADGAAIGTLVTIGGQSDSSGLVDNGVGWLPWSLKYVRETSHLDPVLATLTDGSAA